jgi:hypothetical protein
MANLAATEKRHLTAFSAGITDNLAVIDAIAPTIGQLERGCMCERTPTCGSRC